MKQKIFTVAAALAVALTFGGPAVADCGGNPGNIVTGASQIWTAAFQADPTFFYGYYGGTTYSGIAYTGTTPVSENANAIFWRQGFGDPAPGFGADSGIFDLVATGGLYFSAFPSVGYYGGATILTGWQPGTDDCIDGGNCLCLLITDSDGDDTYYAMASARSAATLTTVLEQGGTDGSGFYQQPIVMAPLSKPSIVGSAGVGPQNAGGGFSELDLSVTVAPTTAGVYEKDGCSCGPVGFKVLQTIVPRGSMPPSDRSVGWQEAQLSAGGPQDVTPLGAMVNVRSTCGAADQDVYLATEMYFDSGFGTSVVSANSTRVECGTNLADPDEKPTKIRPRQDRPTPKRGGR
jgi:hypothetical protein